MLHVELHIVLRIRKYFSIVCTAYQFKSRSNFARRMILLLIKHLRIDVIHRNPSIGTEC